MTCLISQPPASSPQPPSRHANPFATCWTRPGAIPFRFTNDQTAEQLVTKLASQNWRGAIVGPHGSGKSTLLESLKPTISAAGRHVRQISLRDGQRRLPREFWNACQGDHTLAIIDGYEQLSWLERVRLTRHYRRTNIGLLVTTHATTRIPTLIELTPNRSLVMQLVADLCAEVSTTITPNDVAASHACHGSNVREILFDLYDRHEEQRRLCRTSHATTT